MALTPPTSPSIGGPFGLSQRAATGPVGSGSSADSEGVPEAEGDFLDDLLNDYNFICTPELRLKFKQPIGDWTVSTALARPWHHRLRARFVAKPLTGTFMSQFLHKVLVVPTHGQMCVYSSRLPLGILRLQLMASYNWMTRRPAIDYRITTKWTDSGRITRTERYQLCKSVLTRCRWNMDLHLPDMQGHIGAHDSGLEPFDVDYGHMSFVINQVDVIVKSPWGGRQQPGNEAGAISGNSKKTAELSTATAKQPTAEADSEKGTLGLPGWVTRWFSTPSK